MFFIIVFLLGCGIILFAFLNKKLSNKTKRLFFNIGIFTTFLPFLLPILLAVLLVFTIVFGGGLLFVLDGKYFSDSIIELFGEDKSVSSSVLSDLPKIEKDIVPEIREKKLTIFRYDGECATIDIRGIKYVNRSLRNECGKGPYIEENNEVEDFYSKIRAHNISKIDVFIEIQPYKERKFNWDNIEFEFSNWLRADTLFYGVNQDYYKEANQKEIEDYKKFNNANNPDYRISLFYKKVKDNWYESVSLDLRAYQEPSEAIKDLI